MKEPAEIGNFIKIKPHVEEMVVTGIAVVCFCQQGFAQYTKYIVRLTDKGSSPFLLTILPHS